MKFRNPQRREVEKKSWFNRIKSRTRKWYNEPQIYDDGYWVYCGRRFIPEPSGRFLFLEGVNEVKTLLPKLKALIENGKIFAFKYTLEKDPENPNNPKKPILVYFTRRTEVSIKNVINSELGINHLIRLIGNQTSRTGTTFQAREFLEGHKSETAKSSEILKK